MNKRINDLSLEINEIERKSKKGFKKEVKKLDKVRETHPLKMDKSISIQNGCLHGSSSFIIPVQNWVKGTTFEKNTENKTETHNVHSAVNLRNINAKLKDEEMDFIMKNRYRLAQDTIPTHHPNYELRPVYIEPVKKSKKKIWDIE